MSVDGLSAALRAFSFVALFQAAGIAIFVAFFGHLLFETQGAVRRAGIGSAAAAIALILAQYLMEAGRMSGDLAGVMDPALQGLVLRSSAALALAFRLAGLVVIVFALREGGRRPVALTAAGVLLVLAAFTLMGHTASHPHRWLLVTLLLTHLLVVAFWFGALLPLHLATAREPPMRAATVINSFSASALWIVPLLLVAGVALAALLLPGVAALRTAYGQLLLVKIAGFFVLMGLASLNKWRLGPAVASGDIRVTAAFRRSLKAEYLLIAGVLGVTAVLTSFFSPD